MEAGVCVGWENATKRRGCWNFVETLPATCQKRKAVQNYSAQCRSCQQCKKQAAPARRAEARPTSAKRDKCRVRQAASLLGFTASSLAFETLQATSLHFSFCHSAVVLFQKLPSGINTRLAKRELFPSPVYGGRCPKGGRGR